MIWDLAGCENDFQMLSQLHVSSIEFAKHTRKRQRQRINWAPHELRLNQNKHKTHYLNPNFSGIMQWDRLAYSQNCHSGSADQCFGIVGFGDLKVTRLTASISMEWGQPNKVQ